MPDELIEAAARAAYDADTDHIHDGVSWSKVGKKAQQAYRDMIRAAHAVLAPTLLEKGVRLGLEAAAKAMQDDARLCDCFAREEGECACGAWDGYKTVPVARMIELVSALDAAAIAGSEPHMKGEG
jgi:hypothetical protein